MSDNTTKKNLKILIGTPMYGGQCYGAFTESLLRLQWLLLANGHTPQVHFIVNESLITRARNEIVYTFMNSDFDYLLFIDGDHRFKALGVLKMIEEDEDIICGICPKKLINWDSVKEAYDSGVTDLEPYTGHFVYNNFGETHVNSNEKFEIEYGGTGMMLIKRRVFEMIKSKQKTFRSDMGNYDLVEYFKTSVKDGNLLSEDYELCKEWREVGGKIYAAPWLEITHIGTYEFKGNFGLSLK